MSSLNETIKAYLRYEPETGKLFWRVSNRAGIIGAEAGTLGSNGYVTVHHRKQRLLAHRVAWYLSYSCWPKENIDHINGIRSDNRLVNLRSVSRSVNVKAGFERRATL